MKLFTKQVDGFYFFNSKYFEIKLEDYITWSFQELIKGKLFNCWIFKFLDIGFDIEFITGNHEFVFVVLGLGFSVRLYLPTDNSREFEKEMDKMRRPDSEESDSLQKISN